MFQASPDKIPMFVRLTCSCIPRATAFTRISIDGRYASSSLPPSVLRHIPSNTSLRRREQHFSLKHQLLIVFCLRDSVVRWKLQMPFVPAEERACCFGRNHRFFIPLRSFLVWGSLRLPFHCWQILPDSPMEYFYWSIVFVGRTPMLRAWDNPMMRGNQFLFMWIYSMSE